MLTRWKLRYLMEDNDDTGSGAGGSGAGGGSKEGAAGGTEGGNSAGDDGAAKARREAAELRQRLKAAEEERDTLKNAQLSEKERAEKRAADADAAAKAAVERLERASLKAEVGVLAGKVGMRTDAAEAALRLIDTEKVTFTDGEAESASVERALRAAVKEYPFLARSGAGKVDAGDGGGGTAAGKGDLASRINAGLRRASR